LKFLKVSALIVLLMILVAGCGAPDAGNKNTSTDASYYPLTVTDGMGRSIKISEEPRRIVSLAPAVTEILFALDLGDKVVGVTDYCDYPPEAAEKEKVGGFYNPNIEKVLSLEPDLILATGGVQAEVVSQLESLGQKVVVFDPRDMNEIIDTIELVGRITKHVEEAREVTSDIKRRMEKVKEKVAELSGEERVAVFVIVWIDESKIITAGPGSFVSDVIEMAGGINIAGDAQGDYPQYSLEKLLEKDPEVIISIAHGYDNPEDVKKVLQWDELKAVKNDRVYVVSDADILTLPGPRIVDGLETVGRYLYPELF